MIYTSDQSKSANQQFTMFSSMKYYSVTTSTYTVKLFKMYIVTRIRNIQLDL